MQLNHKPDGIGQKMDSKEPSGMIGRSTLKIQALMLLFFQ